MSGAQGYRNVGGSNPNYDGAGGNTSSELQGAGGPLRVKEGESYVGNDLTNTLPGDFTLANNKAAQQETGTFMSPA